VSAQRPPVSIKFLNTAIDGAATIAALLEFLTSEELSCSLRMSSCKFEQPWKSKAKTASIDIKDILFIIVSFKN
jgi:hypothetical protein